MKRNQERNKQVGTMCLGYYENLVVRANAFLMILFSFFIQYVITLGFINIVSNR